MLESVSLSTQNRNGEDWKRRIEELVHVLRRVGRGRSVMHVVLIVIEAGGVHSCRVVNDTPGEATVVQSTPSRVSSPSVSNGAWPRRPWPCVLRQHDGPPVVFHFFFLHGARFRGNWCGHIGGIHFHSNALSRSSAPFTSLNYFWVEMLCADVSR